MAKRFRLSSRKSRRMFRRSAGRVHRKNIKRPITRGGIRL